MATVTRAGTPVTTVGELPQVGSPAPTCELVANDLSPIKLGDYAGKRVVLNIFPSIDTGVCAASVHHFNKLAGGLDNTVVLCVSNDLPFPQGRFCGAEGIENVATASGFRSKFGQHYGLTMAQGPLSGLLARAVVVIEPDGTVGYVQLVPEIKQEPDYDAVVEYLGN